MLDASELPDRSSCVSTCPDGYYAEKGAEPSGDPTHEVLEANAVLARHPAANAALTELVRTARTGTRPLESVCKRVHSTSFLVEERTWT